MNDTTQLPAEVIKALDYGAVSAINALRTISGLGLYDAKLLVDEYLQRHPEHPLSRRMREAAHAEPKSVRGVASRHEIVTADPVAGVAIPLDALPKRIAAGGCYVILREKIDCESWLGEATKACVAAMADMQSLEIVDEERRNNSGDVSGAVLKLLGPFSREAIQGLHDKLQRALPAGVSVRVVAGIQWSAATIPPDELTVEYFLHEFTRQSPMVGATTACVKLTHGPTGTLCRSTAHRNRTLNYEEALLLLISLIRDGSAA
jgi:hypothetical protein